MKIVSIVTPCFNEEENVEELYRRVRGVLEGLQDCDYEHIFIDNASTDGTVRAVKALAATDRRVKLIVNVRNFGHIRSPMHAMMQARGDAVVFMAGDLQDPPELLEALIAKWEAGYKAVVGTKRTSEETFAMALIRKLYYRVAGNIAEVRLVPDYTGFGLYDREIVEAIRRIDDPYPYFRGLIAELGYECAIVPYDQKIRRRGITKNNFYTLYDMAMLGITSHSKVPLRLATMLGFGLGFLSLIVSFGYLGLKLFYWEQFSLGVAPLLIGVFFFASIQLFFIGILGEYIGAIHTQVLKRPLVVERERVNFDEPQGSRAAPRR